MVCRKPKLFVHPLKWPHPRKCSILLGAMGLNKDLGLGCWNFPPGGREQEGFKEEGSPFLRHCCLYSSHLYHEMLSCSPPPPAAAQEAVREGRCFDPAQTNQLLLQNIAKTGLVGETAIWRLMGNLTQSSPGPCKETPQGNQCVQ